MDNHSIRFHRDDADPTALRKAFGKFATGVTIITTRSPEGKLEGLTANSFSSVSLEPPMLLWSLHTMAPSRDSFMRSGVFAINVLAAHQQDVSRHFARPAADKFDGFDFREGLNGCPLVPGALATFECETERIVEAGDHHIFLGNVLRASGGGDDHPLLFVAGGYSRPEASAATRSFA